MAHPAPTRQRRRGRVTALTAAAALCVGVIAATPAAAEPVYEDIVDGLVHQFLLDETTGTRVANTGTAGEAADATLVNPDNAAREGRGIRFNPDDYADALSGAYVRLPNDLTAGTRRMLEDQKGYYLIGYRPDESAVGEKAGSRRRHDLAVRVKRPGLRVRSRESYYGIASEEARKVRRTLEEQLAAAITSPFYAGGLDVRVTPLFFNDPDGNGLEVYYEEPGGYRGSWEGQYTRKLEEVTA